MRALIAIVVLVLWAPVLLLVAIALGPAALAILALAGTAAVLVWIGETALELTRNPRSPRFHG